MDDRGQKEREERLAREEYYRRGWGKGREEQNDRRSRRGAGINTQKTEPVKGMIHSSSSPSLTPVPNPFPSPSIIILSNPFRLGFAPAIHTCAAEQRLGNCTWEGSKRDAFQRRVCACVCVCVPKRDNDFGDHPQLGRAPGSSWPRPNAGKGRDVSEHEWRCYKRRLDIEPVKVQSGTTAGEGLVIML